MLRKHQSELQTLAMDIRTGKPVRNIGAYVTPGGGKSAFAMILAKHLAEPLGWKICWVVPRDALKSQGENDFADAHKRTLFGHTSLIRAAGNDIRPSRENIGYVITYQAIAQNPKLHEDEFKLRQYILILDECHHVPFRGESSDGEAAYYNAVAPLVELSKLTVFASGTLERHDGHKIAFWPYKSAINAETPVTEPNPESQSWAFIRYRRGDALEERAIVPLHFYAMDGRARWFDPKTGDERDVDSMAESNRGDQSKVLMVVLETEYAKQLLDKCVENWQWHKSISYQNAKMLVIAPTISAAGRYVKHLRSSGIDAMIATSEDSERARGNIAKFKKDGQVLVTVGMAYEGLDVPQITHVACLTNIRSRPWIEQCICRANRTAPGKTHGFIYYPDDPRMHQIMAAIEAEQAAVVVTYPKEKRDGVDSGNLEQSVITPLDSAVTQGRGIGLEDGTRTSYDETSAIELAMAKHGIKGVSVIQMKQMMVTLGTGVVPNGDTPKPDFNKPIIPPSQMESNFRTTIDRTIGRIAGNLGAGDKEATKDYKIQINRRVKQRWGERGLCTLSQLQEITVWLEEEYGALS